MKKLTKTELDELNGATGVELRNRGWARMPDWNGGQAVITWHELPPEKRKEGFFILRVQGKVAILQKDELQQLLRNV